jgi:hypothetical protein
VQYVYSGYLNNPKLYTFEEGHISIGLYIAIAKRYLLLISKHGKQTNQNQIQIRSG